MPIYEYRCGSCKQTVEVLVRHQEGPAPRCPQCGSELSDKLPSAHARLPVSTKAATTCCGREERCDRPPCSQGGCCHS